MSTEEKFYCVYKHTSPSEKVYIGITSQKPEYRWDNGNGYKQNIYFYNAIQKYGWENFKHEILFTNLTKEGACTKEKELITLYDSTDRNKGYNLSIGGELSALGTILSDETRRKMSESRIGDKNHFYGKHHSEKTKKIISDKAKKRTRSDEAKRKTSETLKGHIVSEETRKKISDKHSKRSVVQLNKNNEIVATYISIMDAHRQTGVRRAGISSCCQHKQKTAGGFIWRYQENEQDKEN